MVEEPQEPPVGQFQMPEPPEITLDINASFEEVMSQLHGLRTWMERLYWAYNRQNTELIDARAALITAIHTAQENALALSQASTEFDLAVSAYNAAQKSILQFDGRITTLEKKGFKQWIKRLFTQQVTDL